MGSALYRYFPDKESLYEAVFDDTLFELWGMLDAHVKDQQSAKAALIALVDTAEVASKQLPFYAEYLSGVPIEAARNPRFRPFLERRTEVQRLTFARIARLGGQTGEFDDVLSEEELAEHLRMMVIGWMGERALNPHSTVSNYRGLMHLLGLDSGRGR